MEKNINKPLGELLVQERSQQLSLEDLFWGYHAVSLYPTAMFDEVSIFPQIETGLAYTKDMNSELVEKINTGFFNQGNASLKNKFYNPKNLIVQHLPVQERENKIENNLMRNG